MELPGYTIGDTLYAGPRSQVVRATSPDGRPVVVKWPTSQRPSLAELARYQREFRVGTAAEKRATARPERLHRRGSTVALVFEDVGGISLRERIPAEGMRLRPLLEVSLGLASALARLHGSGVIHRDIKPDNAVILPDGEVRWIDLASATLSAETSGEEAAPAPMEGTLAYISPELLGRIHGPVDERSDLYSLGATLFELSTGRVPFTATDSAALAHAHVAQTPPAPHELRPELPPALSQVILTLLQKNPDDRYETANGLAHDLRLCLEALSQSDPLVDLDLRLADRSSRFRLPNRLYGREAEISRLDQAIDALIFGSRVAVSVSGLSGIGKTALVDELRRRLAVERAQFCAGKFDQFCKDLPYLGVLSALRSLLRRELAGSEAALEKRKQQLADALGIHAGLLTAAIPELAAMLGPQPEVEEIAPLDATRRLHRVASRFMGVFATAKQPLVLFIDDLQWADAPSLLLLEALATDPSLTHLMLITGHRSNELGAGHPAKRTLTRLRESGEHYDHIELGPLADEDVTALVADTIHRPPQEVEAIARRINAVAGGNPFFVREFLLSLNRRSFFTWSEDTRRWSWETSELSKHVIPDNVAELLTQRLDGLPQETVDLLDTASCVGGEFELNSLAHVHQISQRRAARGIAPAVARGLIVPLNAEHAVYDSLADWQTLPDADELKTARYRFQHDRVRQTVHERLDAAQRAERHVRIGRLLVEGLSDAELTGRLVEVFDHIAWGPELIHDPEERARFAEIGIRAGSSAMRALAFNTAKRMLEVAAELLPEDSWGEAYDATIRLHLSLASCHHALGDYEGFDEVAARVVAEARTVVDAGRAHGLRIRVANTEGRYDEAVDIGIAVARELGVTLPRSPHLGHVLLGVVRALWAQGSTDAMEFERLEEATDPSIQEAISLLTESASAAYFAEPNLLPLIGMTSTRLSIRHGVTSRSPYGFAVWALVLCGVLGRIENGGRFGELAVAVGRRYGGVDEARASFVVDCFVRHWREPLEDCARKLYETWAYNRDAGDEESATYSAGVMLYTEFFAGVPLDAPERVADAISQLRDSQQPHVKDCFLAWVQLTENLRRPELAPKLAGEWYDHSKLLPGFLETNNGVQIAISSTAAGILDHLAGRLESAAEHFSLASRWEENVVGQVIVPGLAFFQALNAYALRVAHPERGDLLRMARKARKRLQRWAVHAPFNLDHRLALLNAWDARVRGRPAEALLEFHRADALASEGALLYQGLARTGLASVFESLDNLGSARLARSQARQAWLAWGSQALADAAESPQALSSGTTSNLGKVTLEQLDVETLLGALGTISAEIDQQRLLDQLMRTALEASGADRGLLLLREEEKLIAKVEVRVGAPPTQLGVPIEELRTVAGPALALARRSRQPVVVHDAAKDGILDGDAHVEATGLRSLLVAPISYRGETTGWLYLENHVVQGAFTADRVTLTEALASQAGIALDNARLYGRVQRALAEQTALTEANRRFVPQEFLVGLGCESIVDVKLSEVREREMNVLFVDLRGFSKLSLELGARGTVEMINRYLSYIQPEISDHGGFVGQYYGDGVLALFPGEPERALNGAVAMCRGLERYNAERGELPELAVGMGLHSGRLTLGTIGDPDHFQCGVVGDSVNLASRMEGLCKHFGATLVVSGLTRERVVHPDAPTLRRLGRVLVAGRPDPVEVFECVDCYGAEHRQAALESLDSHDLALDAFQAGDWPRAVDGFSFLVEKNPADRVARGFLERARTQQASTAAWDGVERPAKG